MADDDHVAELTKGPAHWNMWRYENVNIRPDLREADLSKANLSGADLIRVHLSKARQRRTTSALGNLAIARPRGVISITSRSAEYA
jgi:uncharacterized protein YjbI with pentapeptide repeats